jgi:hypothetical protein
VQDRARVVGSSNLAQAQLDLANQFVQRPEFVAKYPVSLDGPGFVDAVQATIRNDIGPDLMTQRSALINLFNSGGRGAVMYRLADDNAQTNPVNNRAFIDAEYNRGVCCHTVFWLPAARSRHGGISLLARSSRRRTAARCAQTAWSVLSDLSRVSAEV